MTKAPAPAPLEERLIQMIGLQGPISVADYMRDALTHPQYGYYATRQAIGVDGDFITAPEISQIFGELIGLWLVDSWRAMGSPDAFNLIEFGPGRGVLMADMLRAAKLRPAFQKAAQLWLVEGSGRMRVEQQRRLKPLGVTPLWADDFDDIPPAPSLMIANEFFDCLPIRQFERVKEGWRERLVGLSEDRASLQFAYAKAPPPASLGLDDAPVGAVYELCEEARDLAGRIGALVAQQGGRALIIDYGHAGAGFGDTLQAVKRHEFWPPLKSPGEADLTAHVDFEALSRAALDEGAEVYGPTAQGRFLTRLGVAIRAEMLAKSRPEAADAARAGARRLIAPEEMGEIFKAMAIGRPGLAAPAGFQDL